MSRIIASIAVTVLGLNLACSSSSDHSNLNSENGRRLSFMEKISRVSCVDSVEKESIVTPATPGNGNLKPELGLLIVVKEEFDPSTCATQISDEVKGFQLRQVMSEIGVVSARAKAATASTPRNLEKLLTKISCVTAVEKEFSVGLNSEATPTGNLLVSIEDEFNAAICADDIYRVAPGALIRTQTGPVFVIKGSNKR
jgi:hypothetical protein